MVRETRTNVRAGAGSMSYIRGADVDICRPGKGEKIMKYLSVLVVLTLLTCLGCTHARTRKFVRESLERAPLLVGWKINPSITAYEDMIGVDTTSSFYSMYIDFLRDRPKDVDTLGQISTFEIDQVELILPDGIDSIVLKKFEDHWFTNSDDPQIMRAIWFGKKPILIPLNVLALTIKFTAIVRPRRHFLTPKYDVPHDTVAILENSQEVDTVVVSIPMVRKDTKQSVPFFMKYN